MSAFSDYLENKIIDHVLGGGDFTRPATVYLALFTSAPTDSGGGVEVSGSGYSRAAVTNNATNFPSASGGLKTNGTDISFPAATGSWGTIVAIGIFDAATGGNLLFHNTVDSSKAVASSDTPKVVAGQLQIQLN